MVVNKDGVNDRTNEYGEQLENRCRFLMHILDAVVEAIGIEIVGESIQRTFMISGGFNKELGIKAIAEDDTDLIAYAQFSLKPDLVRRFEIDAPLSAYNAATFYTHDPIVGYANYPFLDENSET
ncbi:12-oxophytodienoate reductase 2 [Bienertia sinuspersici]